MHKMKLIKRFDFHHTKAHSQSAISDESLIVIICTRLLEFVTLITLIASLLGLHAHLNKKKRALSESTRSVAQLSSSTDKLMHEECHTVKCG